jgi:hypothetical protein
MVMGWYLCLGTYLMVRTPVTQLAQDAAMQSWGSLAIPVFGLGTAAFAADWISKQTTIAGPPMNTAITTETTVSDGSATTTTSAVDLPEPVVQPIDPPPTEPKT